MNPMLYQIENKYYVRVAPMKYTEVKFILKNNDVVIQPTKNKLESNGRTIIKEFNFQHEKDNIKSDLLKKQDYWIIATQMEAKDNYYEIDYTDMNFAIVMGSEGKGISKTILNSADFTVKLETNFESLNVSNACAVIIYEALRQIRVKEKNSALFE